MLLLLYIGTHIFVTKSLYTCMYNVCAFINRHRNREKNHKITASNEIIYMYRVVSNINEHQLLPIPPLYKGTPPKKE